MDELRQHEAMKLLCELHSLRASRDRFRELLEMVRADRDVFSARTVHVLSHTVDSIKREIDAINRVLLEQYFE